MTPLPPSHSRMLEHPIYKWGFKICASHVRDLYQSRPAPCRNSADPPISHAKTICKTETRLVNFIRYHHPCRIERLRDELQTTFFYLGTDASHPHCFTALPIDGVNIFNIYILDASFLLRHTPLKLFHGRTCKTRLVLIWGFEHSRAVSRAPPSLDGRAPTSCLS